MSLRSLLPLLLLLGVGCVPSHEGHGHEGPEDGHDRQDEPPHAAAHHAEHSGDGHQEGVVELDPAAAEASGIRAEPATLRTLLPELRTTGRVAFNENRLAHVGPRTEGRVTEVRADLGASLSSGQVVAILDSVELGRARADFLSARADLKVARAELMRKEALLTKKIASEAEALAAGAAFEQARAHASAAAETLRVLGLGNSEIESLDFGAETPGRLALRAPFAGTLVDRHLQRGEFVSRHDTLFTVADLSSLWIWIDVYEKDLSRVHLGDQANVEVEAWPGRSWTGTVTYLRDAVDSHSRTVRARIEVSNTDGALRPEMFASVQLLDPHHEDANAAEVLAVPDSAVQRGIGGSVVYVMTAPGRYEQRTVRLGHRSGGFAEILAGLAPGEQVVVAHALILKTETSRKSPGGIDNR